jgi:cytoskeleton protein RodZ
MSRALVIGGAIAALALFAIVGWVAKREVPAEPQTVSSSQEQATPAASVGEAQPPQTSAPDTAVPAAEEPAHKGQEMPKPTETAASPEKTEDVAAAEATTTAAQSGSLALRFVFGTQPSWIEVTQADGSIVYSGLNEAGTERRVVGQPPLKLVVGNASTVTLESHGKPVELAPHIRSNDLARLTIE